MKKKDNAKIFWYLTAIGFIILFILILLSSVLDVGERLRNIQIGGVSFVEYGFYALVLLLIYVLILRPVHIILFSPSFSIDTTVDNEDGSYSLHKRVAKRLIKGDVLSDESKTNLTNALKDKDHLRDALNVVYNNDIKKYINKLIQKNAKTVMVSTAISQNSRVDFFSVIVVNLKMIKEIVQTCGFRPSYSKLAKLTINVVTTALVAEGLEDVDITEVVPQSTALQAFTDFPGVRVLTNSITQGVSNALLTLRIGVVTRKYLFTDAQEVTKEKLRRDALLEAVGMLPLVVGDAMVSIPKKFMNMFKKSDKKEPKSQ